MKNQDHVDFPLSGLNMSQYLSKLNPHYSVDDNIYDLYGVINHFGSLNFGHYTANCYNEEAKAWFNFNDSSVTKIMEPGTGNLYVSNLQDDDPITEQADMDHVQEHAAQAQWSRPNHDTPYLRERIVSSAAYVLFYMKRGFRLSGPTDFEKIKVEPSGCADYMFEQAKKEDEEMEQQKKNQAPLQPPGPQPATKPTNQQDDYIQLDAEEDEHLLEHKQQEAPPVAAPVWQPSALDYAPDVEMEVLQQIQMMEAGQLPPQNDDNIDMAQI